MDGTGSGSAVPPSLQAAVDRLLPSLEVDEERDLVRWTGLAGERRETGLHDYAGLYAVPGLYEAVYVGRLQARSPQLLAGLLADAVPALPALTVLDVGCGTGAVGSALRARGAGRVVGVDLEPAVETAVRRDRPGTYAEVRALDLLALQDDERAWLDALAPDVVTCVAAVGFGHLPLAAFEVLTDLLRPGGLLAVTVARDLREDPALAGYAALLDGPAYAPVAARDGVHRVTLQGAELRVTALVLRRRGLPGNRSLTPGAAPADTCPAITPCTSAAERPCARRARRPGRTPRRGAVTTSSRGTP